MEVDYTEEVASAERFLRRLVTVPSCFRVLGLKTGKTEPTWGSKMELNSG